MNRKYFYIVLALAAFCLLLILFSLIRDRTQKTPSPKYVNFPIAPFKTYISALGVVQANGGNISLGAPTDRIVEDIPIHVGQKVEKGQLLMLLKNKDLEAELNLQKVALEQAKLTVKKLESLPRKEDLISAQAALTSAQIEYNQAKKGYEMVEGLQNNRAVSLEEINRRQANYRLAEAKLNEAKAEAAKVEQGTWQPDLELARLQVLQAEANVDRIKAEIAKTILTSPVDGTVIEVKSHVGEYPSYPVLIVGNTQELELKVNINQFDAPYFKPEAPAVAFLQGDSSAEVELEFVKLTPFLTTKQNLSNDVKEIVDTKVLQVLYRIKHKIPGLYVGQPMDVYIQAEYNKS